MNILKNRFKDKVMLITGAARGIGKAVALRAYKEGAAVVLTDLIEDEGRELEREILNDNGKALFIKADLSYEDNVKDLVQKAVDKFGRVDILINNAGVSGTHDPIHIMSKENFDFVFRINFYSVYFSCKHVIKEFLKQNQGGAIVNTASIGGIVALKNSFAYVASKHAINGLTKNLAIDYAKYGIRVNSINPAPTKTPMEEEAMRITKNKIEQAIKNGLIKPSEVDKIFGQKSQSLLQRLSESEEQAASILFLASDDASHMTGTILQTDGGWTAF